MKRAAAAVRDFLCIGVFLVACALSLSGALLERISVWICSVLDSINPTLGDRVYDDLLKILKGKK